MPFKSTEEKRAWRRLYYAANRERHKEWKRTYETKHAARLAADRAGRRKPPKRRVGRDPEKVKLTNRAFRNRLRDEALHLLGGQCERCGYSERQALQFDHRKPLLRRLTQRNLSRASEPSLREIIAMGPIVALTKYALLCANCHVLKTHANREYSGNPISGPDGGDRIELNENDQLKLFGSSGGA